MDEIHIKHGHSEEENPAVSHEQSDIDIFAVTKFGVGLAIGTLITVFAMWAMFDYLWKHNDQAVEQLPPSVIEARKGLLPPEPRLQSMGDLRSPSVELGKYREDEKSLLDHYSWVDPDKGTVRIPIEEAKDLVLKKGLAVKITPEGHGTPRASNPGGHVGTSSAAQPQRVYDTGAAAIGSAPVTKGPEEETGEKK